MPGGGGASERDEWGCVRERDECGGGASEKERIREQAWRRESQTDMRRQRERVCVRERAKESMPRREEALVG